MPREVVINGSTFIVNSYSSSDATETLDELLKRVIVSNAEREFKKRPFICALYCRNRHDNGNLEIPTDYLKSPPDSYESGGEITPVFLLRTQRKLVLCAGI
ncbi:MAG: transposon-encoded TnpW family protein, partial [Oscillospiraceae bacterium]|nr:transposon-encoded TnpW family protein [Oscillospiraceae bacterium]